ncbi:hypothetical protein MUP59_07770, partial [Candidatus Bathyarchaeota archaeon]|nr:hypothetical protein [Candidatus Bathyarchaeota archaeon]
LLVRFSAFLTQAAAVIYNSTRKPLKAAEVRTVQGAIDQLCDQLSRLQKVIDSQNERLLKVEQKLGAKRALRLHSQGGTEKGGN